MTSTTQGLAHFNDEAAHPEDPVFWILGAAGAVSIRFYVTPIPATQVGRYQLIMAYRCDPATRQWYSIYCTAAVCHWPAHRPDPPGVEPEYHDVCFEKEACEFLETHCRHWVGSSTGPHIDFLQDALAAGNRAAIEAWLECEYREFLLGEELAT